MEYIQTCTSLKNSTMGHPKGGHHSVLSLLKVEHFFNHPNCHLFIELMHLEINNLQTSKLWQPIILERL